MLSTHGRAEFRREAFATLIGRLRERRRFIQVVAGPRQVGKATLVRQVVRELDLPVHMASADHPGLRDRAWLAAQWEAGRVLARGAPMRLSVLVLDEVQKIPAWSETVQRLWDEDAANGLDLRVVVLGSAPLLVQRGLSESLTGRFSICQAEVRHGP